MLPLHLWKISYPFQTRIGNLKLKIRDIFSLQAQEIWALSTTRPQIPRGIKHNPVTFLVILCLVVICLKIGEHHLLKHSVTDLDSKTIKITDFDGPKLGVLIFFKNKEYGRHYIKIFRLETLLPSSVPVPVSSLAELSLCLNSASQPPTHPQPPNHPPPG